MGGRWEGDGRAGEWMMLLVLVVLLLVVVAVVISLIILNIKSHYCYLTYHR
jgi:hypothetical protein